MPCWDARGKRKHVRATLVEFTDIAPGVRHFVFEAPVRLQFSPGQFVSLSDQVNGKTITRAYSIASVPDGNRFELCLNRVEGGAFSPHLFDFMPGDAVEMREPLGTFTLRQPLRDSILIATGTGIAPFRSMLLTAVGKDSPPMTLLFGVRYRSHLLYAQEFEDLAARHPQFRFWPTLTQPDGEWKGRTGRVQKHLKETIGGKSELDFYICGMKALVDEVRQILKDQGFDRKQIRSEKYD